MNKLILVTTVILLVGCNNSNRSMTKEQFKISQAEEVQNKLEFQRDQGVVMYGVVPRYTDQQIQKLIDNTNQTVN